MEINKQAIDKEKYPAHHIKQSFLKMESTALSAALVDEFTQLLTDYQALLSGATEVANCFDIKEAELAELYTMYWVAPTDSTILRLLKLKELLPTAPPTNRSTLEAKHD